LHENGIPVNFPWFGRIKDGIVRRNGKTYDLKKIPGVEVHRGHALHGMVQHRAFQIDNMQASEHGLSLTASFDTRDHPQIAEIFGESRLTLTTVLTGPILAFETENDGGRFGLHPWVRSHKKMKLKGKLAREYRLRDEIPSGFRPSIPRIRDISEGKLLEDLTLDHAYKPLVDEHGLWSVTLEDEEAGQSIQFTGNRGFSDVVLWNGMDDSTSVEPGNLRSNPEKRGLFMISVHDKAQEVEKKAGVDTAIVTGPSVKEPGGILFDPALIKMKVKRDAGGEPIRFQPIHMPIIDPNIFEGFYYEIINMAPANLPLILGLEGESDNDAPLQENNLNVSIPMETRDKMKFALSS